VDYVLEYELLGIGICNTVIHSQYSVPSWRSIFEWAKEEICSGGPDGDDFTITLALHLNLFYPAMTMRRFFLSVLAVEASVLVLGSSASGHLYRERQLILLSLPQHLLTLLTTYYHCVSLLYELVKVCCILRTFILHILREHGDDQT
jgi:hypothetical protein